MSDPSTSEEASGALEKLDKLTRFASEDLARGINRRSFLRRAGTGAFTFMIAVATGKMLTPRPAAAASGTKPPVTPSAPVCSPPGPYCNYDGAYPGTPTPAGAHTASSTSVVGRCCNAAFTISITRAAAGAPLPRAAIGPAATAIAAAACIAVAPSSRSRRDRRLPVPTIRTPLILVVGDTHG